MDSSTQDPEQPDGRHSLDAVVRLVWSEPSQPSEKCHYNHTIAETPFGRLLLTWKGWKDYPDYGFDETPWGEVEYRGWSTVEEAQKWAAEEMQRRILLCYEPNGADERPAPARKD